MSAGMHVTVSAGMHVTVSCACDAVNLFVAMYNWLDFWCMSTFRWFETGRLLWDRPLLIFLSGTGLQWIHDTRGKSAPGAEQNAAGIAEGNRPNGRHRSTQVHGDRAAAETEHVRSRSGFAVQVSRREVRNSSHEKLMNYQMTGYIQIVQSRGI